jgi:hypothetical protein
MTHNLESRPLLWQLLQRRLHSGRRLITVGSGALADCGAVERDHPPVEAGLVGIDPDGVATMACRPELVPRVVLALVLHHGGIVSLRCDPSSGPRARRGSPRGASWGREPAVTPGQPRCLADNQTDSSTAISAVIEPAARVWHARGQNLKARGVRDQGLGKRKCSRVSVPAGPLEPSVILLRPKGWQGSSHAVGVSPTLEGRWDEATSR